MRFIGNKESITSDIINFLDSKGLTGKKLSFFDAFCGTGSVSDALKDSFDLIVNDILYWCVIYTKGRIYAHDCDFCKLGFDPFNYINSCNNNLKGFFFKNYSPGGSDRMYFSPENAGRIDYFRFQIEEWNNNGLLSENEYAYLLSCLIESVSDVSNTAGVYGAFLKKWDSRALKPISFNKVDSRKLPHNRITYFNRKIEEIISEVSCDILYLDPPYTQNQYGTQYHLLETLVLNDNPDISPITGSRFTAPIRSDWSKEYKTHILFDKVIAKTKAKYILFNYNNDGFMTKDFIEASLKRYGKYDTYICKTFSYKKYRNFKTKGDKEHFEYLFFIEKKNTSEIVYESPLNYIGNKSKMIQQIRNYLPTHYTNVLDIFGGGFNVGINIKAEHVVYNDINFFVRQLVESFKVTDTYSYLLYIRQIIKKFGLKKAYGENYLKARVFYNSLPLSRRDPKILYAIILYGYQQQIRFNGEHKFNNPVGMRWFNDKVLEKMISFSRIIKEIDCTFNSVNFTQMIDCADHDSFVYMDPPYRLTTGAYNDGKRGFEGWTKVHERMLFDFADQLNNKGIPFMISYVNGHNGKSNINLLDWLNSRKYSVFDISPIPGRERQEILIINYEH